MLNNMIDNVIRKFGFEDAHTIRFCKLAETFKAEELQATYMMLMIM